MPNQTHDDITDLIPAYALGALDADEAAQVEQHLTTCARCQADLAAYEAVTDMLPQAAQKIEPSPALKKRLLAQIQTTNTAVPPAPSRWQTWIDNLHQLWRTPRWQPVLALAAVAVLIAAFALWQQAPPVPQQIELTATNAAPDAEGVIEIATNGRATLTVNGLPPLAAEQQYQLWLIEDGQRASGAIFSVSDTGAATVTITAERPLATYSAFGITIEPAGGSPGPTGERVLGHNL